MGRNSRGGHALAAVVADLARRQVESVQRPISIGTVVDSRPLHLSVRINGYDDPVEVTASDQFDLFPLETTDLVVVVPLPGGAWHVLDRLTGAEPEIRIGVDDIDAPVVLGGSPWVTDPKETARVKLQGYRPAAEEVAAGAVNTITWTFEEAYDEIPLIVASAQGTAADASYVTAAVGTVSETQATLYLRNRHTDPVTVRLVALATGVV